jgi:hypothetical protein
MTYVEDRRSSCNIDEEANASKWGKQRQATGRLTGSAPGLARLTNHRPMLGAQVYKASGFIERLAHIAGSMHAAYEYTGARARLHLLPPGQVHRLGKEGNHVGVKGLWVRRSQKGGSMVS